jgi:SM-20-related protein
MYEKQYSKITDALVDKAYIIIEDAIDIKVMDSLLNRAKQEILYERAGISNSSNLHLDNKIRRDKILWIDPDTKEKFDFLDFAYGLKQYLNRALYLGLTSYEAHFSIYENGDFYAKHLDAFKNSKTRLITTVFYLNEEWNEIDGGELVIYDENDNILKIVIPKANTLVVFLSDKFPHEVKAAKKMRYSIAGWFRVDKH